MSVKPLVAGNWKMNGLKASVAEFEAIAAGYDATLKAKAELAAFKVPERLVIIDDFPATVGTNGRKVRVEVLREWATALLSDQSAHR